MTEPINLSLLRSLEANRFTKVPITTNGGAKATVRDASGHWVTLYRNMGWVIVHVGRTGYVDIHFEHSVGKTVTKSLGQVLLTTDLCQELAANDRVLWIQDWDSRSPLWIEGSMAHSVSGAHSRALVLDFGEPVWEGTKETLPDIMERRKN